MWRIVKDLKQPLHNSLRNLSIYDYPYTVGYVIKRRMLIDSFLELPKEKQPPKSIIDKPSELEEWFDRVYDTDKQTEFNIPIDEVED